MVRDDLSKLKAENERQKNYIELIEREIEMQRIVNKTKSLLAEGSEDRLRPSWEATSNKTSFY